MSSKVKQFKAPRSTDIQSSQMTVVREGGNSASITQRIRRPALLYLGLPRDCACERVTLQGGHAPAA